MGRGRRVALAVLACCVVGPVLATRARAGDAERAVMQEILDVLRQNDQITQGQYENLRLKLDKASEIDAATERAGKVEAVDKVESVESVEAVEKVDAVEAVEVVEEKKPPPDTFRAYWKDGPRFETADEAFKFAIIGRIQNDWAIIDSSDALQQELGIDELQTGTEFRRARLGVEGELYRDYDFKFELDFAGGEVAFKDVYIGANHVPYVQNVRIGHFKEPFSLEQLTSSKYITFMERSLADVFAPERNTGVGIHPAFLDERMTYAFGLFRGNTRDTGDDFGGRQDYDLTTRLTGLPWYADEGAQLVHLGLSYSHQFRSNEELRYRQRPESHLSERFVDTGDFIASGVDLINPELAVVFGPVSLQAEYMRAYVDASEVNDPAFDGWYAFVSYFVTGEHRVYKLAKAAFDKVKPRRNFAFGRDSGWGAWEVAARYSKLNLDSGEVQGGNLGDTTLGLNWYLNPNIRIMANYIYSGRTDTAGSANIYQSRFQVFW